MDLSQFQANYTPYNFGSVSGPQKKKQRGRGGMATSLISEAGGTGGALAGAATGAAIGSVVPVLGTAIGGLVGAGVGGFLGGTGGRALENKVRDNEYRIGDSVKEGAISGILGAGPGQLLKLGAKGGIAAKGAANTLESALMAAGENGAASAPLKTSIRGKLLNAGNKLLESQYDTVSKPVARANKPRETIGQLADYGILKPVDAERIAGKVTGTNGIINKAVISATDAANKVSTANVPTVLNDAIKSIGLVDSDAKSVANIVKAQMGRLGGGEADPGQVLQVMKSLEKRAADLQGKGGTYHLATSVDNDKAKALKAVHDELETNLFNVADANGNISKVLTPQFREQLVKLHPSSQQWQKFVDDKVMKVKGVADLRSTMAPFVKISKIINEGDDNAITFGGRGGNLFNKLANGGGLGVKDKVLNAAAGAVKDPLARAGGTALRTAGGQMNTDVIAPGAKGIASRIGLGGLGEAAGSTYGAMRAGVPAFSAGMRSAEDNAPQTLDDAVLASQNTQDPTGGMQSPDMGQAQSSNPYSKENLLADIQRDPTNAAKYIDQYKQLDEIFSPAAGQKLNSTQIQQANTASSGIDSLNTIAQLLQDNPNAAKLSALPGGSLTSSLTGTGSYRAAVTNAVDAIGRLRSGGAINADEEKRFKSFLPASFDDPKTVQYKLQALNNIFQRFASPQSAGANTLEDALMNQGSQ